MKKIEAMIITFIRANNYAMVESLRAVYEISAERYAELKAAAAK